jgi:uncharacterized membrane protein
MAVIPQNSPHGVARQTTADLAKGIAVLLMIQVHLMEVFAHPSIYSGPVGRVSLFLGGPPVAPVYMAILGYFVAKSRRSMPTLLVRGASLLAVAFLLNIGLNAHILWKIHSSNLDLNPLRFIFGSDILFLAGFSVLVLVLIRNFIRKFAYSAILLALLVVIATPYVNKVVLTDGGAKYILAFVAGDYSWSYFPIFPWLAYPLIGFGFASLQPHIVEAVSSKAIKGVLLGILIVGLLATHKYAVDISADLDMYYHHGLLFFLWVLAFLLAWIMILDVLGHRFQVHPVGLYMRWLGRNILIIYVIQWLLIGNIGTSIYRTQSLIQLRLWFVCILILTSVATISYLEIIKRSRHNSFQTCFI